MAVTFHLEDQPESMLLCASLCEDALAWSEGADWLREFATWFHVFDGKDCIGFFAWVDHVDGRRVMHIGVVPGARRVGFALLRGIKMAGRLSGGRPLCAYISKDQDGLRKLLKSLKFKSSRGNLYERCT